MTIYKCASKLDRIIQKFEEGAIFFLLALMLSVVFIGILNRFFIRLPLPWAEELARYLMIWAAFIGASLGVRRGIHISIDSVSGLLSKKIQRVVFLFSNIACFILCTWIFLIGMDFIERLISTKQLSPAMRVSMYYAYASVPFGFFLMSVRYLIQFIYDVREFRRAFAGSAREETGKVKRDITS